MVRPILGFCLAVTLIPLRVESQPYSDSMADCAGLAGAMAHFIETPERRATAEEAAALWTEAAISEAVAEGRDRPTAAMTERIEATMQDWIDEGPMLAFTEDFRDWASYCRKFGRAQGVF